MRNESGNGDEVNDEPEDVDNEDDKADDEKDTNDEDGGADDDDDDDDDGDTNENDVETEVQIGEEHEETIQVEIGRPQMSRRRTSVPDFSKYSKLSTPQSETRSTFMEPESSSFLTLLLGIIISSHKRN